MTFIPLHNHTHYSLLKGLSKPQQIAERCALLKYKSCAITDYGSVSGIPGFIKALKDVCICGKQKKEHVEEKGKCRVNNGCMEFRDNKIKPILGSKFLICKDNTLQTNINNELSSVCILAKNLFGWKNLVKLSTLSNSPKYFFQKPRLTLDNFSQFKDKNLIAFTGSIGSELANLMFTDYTAAYSSETYEGAKQYIDDNWKEKLIQLAGKYVNIFGSENLFLETQFNDTVNCPASEIVSKTMRWLAKKLNIKCIATVSSYYVSEEQASDHRVLLASGLETTLNKIRDKVEVINDIDTRRFLKSNRFYIPESTSLESIHEPEELKNTLFIAEMCESYNIFGSPKLPRFPTPDNKSSDEYLRELCLEGWKTTVAGRVPEDKWPEYTDRMNRELNVFKEAGTQGTDLASYFLIVADYCNYAKKQGWLMSPGRGSGAGSLVAMLIGVTDKSVDPIENDLLFERFYNAGRNSPGRVSLPDVDSDFPVLKRAEIKQYVRNKYGEDRVCDMVTFSTMKGRGALKDVLRVHEACSFIQMNIISSFIPQEAEIADQLQIMREETGEASIIRWALENETDSLKEWCKIEDNGELSGEYSKLFAQAIRLEGTKRNPGKHPSGLIICSENLFETCPMVYDKNSKRVVAGIEMNDLEAMGYPKFDILGLALLDKLGGVQDLLLDGEIHV